MSQIRFFFGGMSFGQRKTAVIMVRFNIAQENYKFNFKNCLVFVGFICFAGSFNLLISFELTPAYLSYTMI